MGELVEKAIQGNADAFLELMEMHTLSMYKVARGILRNDADVADAVQENPYIAEDGVFQDLADADFDQ